MWTAIVRILSKTILGELFTRLLKNTASTIFKMLTDKENNRKAYKFVKELNARTDLSNSEKAKEFNKKMLEWAKSVGRELKESTINCLREFAVSIIKAEAESSSKYFFFMTEVSHRMGCQTQPILIFMQDCAIIYGMKIW